MVTNKMNPITTAERLFPLSLELTEEWKTRADKAEAEVERLRGQLTRAVSIAGVLLADIEDFHEGDSDDEWTRRGWNDSRISKYLLQGLREEIK